MSLKEQIEAAYQNRELLKDKTYQDAVKAAVEAIDKGKLRVSVKSKDGWEVQQWVKQAILLYFAVEPMQTWSVAPFEFYDKILLKKDYASLGVRAVPHAVAHVSTIVPSST